MPGYAPDPRRTGLPDGGGIRQAEQSALSALACLRWLMHEVDACSDMDVAEVNAPKAATAPEEVHLGDQHPVAIRRYRDGLRPVAIRARTLHIRVEPDRGSCDRRAGACVFAAREDVWLIRMKGLHPPVAVAKGAAGMIGGAVGIVDVRVAVGWNSVVADIWKEH